MAVTGKQWCEKVYAEKLAAKASLPNLGEGYSDEYRAAYAVQSIARRKLYADKAMRAPLSLPAWSKKFWREVMDCSNELMSKAPPKPSRGFGAKQKVKPTLPAFARKRTSVSDPSFKPFDFQTERERQIRRELSEQDAEEEIARLNKEEEEYERRENGDGDFGAAESRSKRAQEFMALMSMGEHVWPYDLTNLAPALWEPAARGDDAECALVIAEHLQKVLEYEVTLDDDEDQIQAEAFLDQMFAGKVKADVALKMMPADNLNSDFNATMGVRFYR